MYNFHKRRFLKAPIDEELVVSKFLILEE